MRVLGISAFYHDSAAALVVDGRVVAAAQQERFSRRKHDAGFPEQAILSCLALAGLALRDLDLVVFYDKPLLKFERLLETYLAFAPRGFRSFSRAMPIWLREKLFLRRMLTRELHRLDPGFDAERKLGFCEHHLSHAASAFYPSPFDEAAVLTLDGVGEWATSSVALGQGHELRIQREIHFPHSLGLLYSAFTLYTGFRVNSGEYKLMGLAPYGQPHYATTIRDHLIDIKPDGSFRLDLRYFDYCTGLSMINARFEELLGGPARIEGQPLEQRHMDLAASIQLVTEEVILAMTRALAAEKHSRRLCLAGGVALNCVANGKVLRQGAFDQVWVQPASGDAGGALGAALYASFAPGELERHRDGSGDAMQGAYLGPAWEQVQIEQSLTDCGARFEVVADAELFAATAQALDEGRAVGWFQGRMEFGPRALGNRSILADPRSPAMQSTLNLKVKYRESFRPFAPAVLREELAGWFDLDEDSPYMLLVAQVQQQRLRELDDAQRAHQGLDRLRVERSEIPAVTHVDGSARVQTVHAEHNPRFHRLITEFHRRTGCPVLVNTSFNVRGEPIVCTPEDAFRCFMGTGIELLVVGNCVLHKDAQDPGLRQDCRSAFAPD